MTLVFTAAVMDMLHTGHINLLRKMRERGDLTMVILHDGFTTFESKGKLPIESLEKRTRNLIDTGLVDIVRYAYSPLPKSEFWETVRDYRNKFDLVYMRGDDWRDFPGRVVLDDLGVPIEFVPYTKGVSSTELRKQL
jgi:glycerol-3-phosphate cytidylyltransferase